jgi:L-seryl-tRNA(Ser) seleniumtransferase
MRNTEKNGYENIPSVDRLLTLTDGQSFSLTHRVRVRLIQEVLAEVRKEISLGGEALSPEAIIDRTREAFAKVATLGMSRVINATGVVLHTNLGRAPLGNLLAEMAEELGGYCTLELDPERGERGDRADACVRLLRLLCGAEAALIVNNNASALFLTLHQLARGKEVLVSRGELVQIGGGFRVPDILAEGGCRLREVGTTNMTTLDDYRRAFSSETALVLKVHPSNFVIHGHTESVSVADLAEWSRSVSLPLVVDLGSGAIEREAAELGEPTVEEMLRARASLVCFSGDKLLGGPQAGIIVGNDTALSALRRSPLYRALRLGKTEIFLLERTLRRYLRNERPVTWSLIRQPEALLRERAERVSRKLLESIRPVHLVEGTGSVGGGTLPGLGLPTILIEFSLADTEGFSRRLANGSPRVVVRRDNKKIGIDLRTVFPEEEELLIQKIGEALPCSS